MSARLIMRTTASPCYTARRCSLAFQPIWKGCRSVSSTPRAVSEQDQTPSAPSQQPAQSSQPAAASRPAAARRPMPPSGRPMPGTPPVPLGPDGKPLQLVSVEKEGKEAFAGIAALDDGKDFNIQKAALLAAGDVTALVVFAAIGRASHGEPLNLETIGTALPFIIGWLTSAALLNGFGAEAQGGKVGPAALTAAKCWAVGFPLGLGLRALSRGYMPATAFIIVSAISTAVFLVGWRSALAAVTKDEVPKTRAEQLAARKNRQGNPFEALQMIMSMTKRW